MIKTIKTPISPMDHLRKIEIVKYMLKIESRNKNKGII